MFVGVRREGRGGILAPLHIRDRGWRVISMLRRLHVWMFFGQRRPAGLCVVRPQGFVFEIDENGAQTKE